ncbi:hypothetical protein BT69DRAFT_262976 [Atractiella rhizophila]|nr:hypothetical protein BT69DRAFT_262976 [Atractiella rhizophila]
MALNGAVDAPVNGGIPMYRKAFFGSDFILANPDKAYLVKRLQEAIEAQVKTLDRCMRLHEMLAPPEMKPFHLTLKQFFERNFAEEIARLPPEPYSPPNPRLFESKPLQLRHNIPEHSISRRDRRWKESREIIYPSTRGHWKPESRCREGTGLL